MYMQRHTRKQTNKYREDTFTPAAARVKRDKARGVFDPKNSLVHLFTTGKSADAKPVSSPSLTIVGPRGSAPTLDTSGAGKSVNNYFLKQYNAVPKKSFKRVRSVYLVYNVSDMPRKFDSIIIRIIKIDAHVQILIPTQAGA